MRLLPLVLASATIATVLVFPADAGTPTTLELQCTDFDGTADVLGMETEYLESGCWGHVGAHTYFVGRDQVYALHGGSGRVFSVEQQLAPPMEVGDVDVANVHAPISIETSMDGLTWEAAGAIQYELVNAYPFPIRLNSRQNLLFTFEAEGQEFRFLRVREPLSATQGLSGYLDHSDVLLEVTPLRAAPSPTLTAREDVGKSCLFDILEDFFDAHPCWYGGLDRWDSPSFMHTYYLGGEAELDAISGTALFTYFRPEDPGTCCGQTPQGILTGDALVQTSVDGAHWDTVAAVPVVYDVPLQFEVAGLDGKSASFIRLVSGKHPGYWEHPALKHPEAYLHHSKISLTGNLPE